MNNKYADVTTRFLRKDERLVLSEEEEIPLVLEAKEVNNLSFLQEFLQSNSEKILEDLAHYGAVLLRGFAIDSDEDFEKAILSIKGLRGISEAFMSEEGRTHVNHLKYILHTNSVYKTGGTLYLGGFHSENYYSPDVPTYISFCCRKPSRLGGETGLINMEKIYECLDEDLKRKLEKSNFFVSKWLVSEIAKRYQISIKQIEKIARDFDLPLLKAGSDQFILMYKPNIYENPKTKKRALQINLFEISSLNGELRKCFMQDYSGKNWFWHRFVWRLPAFILKIIEYIYLIIASLTHSPKNAVKLFLTKCATYKASLQLPVFDDLRVGSCFNKEQIKNLAELMRRYYSSCLWKKGDILLVDNRKLAHAGMPGSGPRLIRALICNPLAMTYSPGQSGHFLCKESDVETIGYYMREGLTRK